MPALVCCRAVFVCMDDLFCRLPFKRFVPRSIAQEKAFKVMDVLDAQARTFAVLFLRCCAHGAVQRISNLTLCMWCSQHLF